MKHILNFIGFVLLFLILIIAFIFGNMANLIWEFKINKSLNVELKQIVGAMINSKEINTLIEYFKK